MSAYYNEIDPFAADWLRCLIKKKLIPDGYVDQRSIKDVQPMDLWGFDQCHWFAGIAGWPRALRMAGVPDDFRVWTGSCPCGPFSIAGKRKGFDDPRHLWPAWQPLIEECCPDLIFGEQVAKAVAWLALVRGDLERMDYAVGVCPIEAASAGAYHFRDRYWFVAHRAGSRCENGIDWVGGSSRAARSERRPQADGTPRLGPQSCTLADDDCERRQAPIGLGGDAGAQLASAARDGVRDAPDRHDAERRPNQSRRHDDGRQAAGRLQGDSDAPEYGAGDVGDDPLRQWDDRQREALGEREEPSRGPDRHVEYDQSIGWGEGWTESELQRWGPAAAVASIDGVQVIECPDGKWRRLPPPRVRWLGTGIPARVALLRGFGNAIDIRPATAFITAALGAIEDCA